MHPLPAIVQFKEHGFEVYGDTLRVSKKVDRANYFDQRHTLRTTNV